MVNIGRRHHSVIWRVAVPVLLAGLLFTHPAHAGVTGCRTDPVVILSNGVTLDLSASVSNASTAISHVTYDLHAPKGTFVLAVLYPDGSQPVSSFKFEADNASGHYDGFTTVSTGGANSVAAAFVVLSAGLNGVVLDNQGVTGQSGSVLAYHLAMSQFGISLGL